MMDPNNFKYCCRCCGELNSGFECTACGFDMLPIVLPIVKTFTNYGFTEVCELPPDANVTITPPPPADPLQWLRDRFPTFRNYNFAMPGCALQEDLMKEAHYMLVPSEPNKVGGPVYCLHSFDEGKTIFGWQPSSQQFLVLAGVQVEQINQEDGVS